MKGTVAVVSLKVISAGGWLANALNQLPDGFRGDRRVRPYLAIYFVAFFVFVAVMLFPLGPSGVSHTNPSRSLEALAISISSALTALLVTAGLLAGYLPFAPMPTQPERSTYLGRSQLPPETLEVFVTGVLEAGGKQYRYRSRPARLTGIPGGVIRLEVRPWFWWWGQLGLARDRDSQILNRFDISTTINPTEVSSAVPGTAYLVFSRKPAVKFGWTRGPLIVASNRGEERDILLGYLYENAADCQPH